MQKPSIEEAKKASHEQLARWWRFLPDGTLQDGDPVSETIEERLFKEHNGIPAKLSKKIGWSL